MKNPAKNLITAILFGSALLVASFSSAASNDFAYNNHTVINLSNDEPSEEETREFWDKFKISVMPKDEPPKEAPPPKEVHPREVHPKEKQPKEVHRHEVR